MENNFNNEPLFGEENVQPAVEQHPNFIESNTAEISYDDILHKCIVPTFSDNTLTISHPEFIQVVGKAAEKIYIVGEVFDTNKMEASDVKWKLQRRLFQWLGLDPNGKFNYKVDSVSYLSPNKVEFKFSRHYGDYYDRRFIHKNCIFSYDKQILLGEGYQIGCTADFSHHPGRYVIRHHMEAFVNEYKETVKPLHCSRIKGIEISEIPDQITITYEFYGKKKKNP